MNSKIKKIIDNLKKCSKGGRNEALNKAAYSVGGIISEADESESDIIHELLCVAISIGLGDRESLYTIQRGLQDGMNRPIQLGLLSPKTPVASVPRKSNNINKIALATFWRRCRRITMENSPEVAMYAKSRHLSIYRLFVHMLAKAKPPNLSASFWPYHQSYALIVPAYDKNGDLASVQARKISNGKPKTVWPKGHSLSGVVFCGPSGVATLRRAYMPSHVIFAEGLIDYLWLSCYALDNTLPYTIFGIASGSMSVISHLAELLQCKKAPVIAIGTDNDSVGNKYAKEISRFFSFANPKRIEWKK